MEIKSQLRKWASENGYSSEMVEEYINEAEHQDGDGYWKNFASVDEAVADFQLYYQNYI